MIGAAEGARTTFNRRFAPMVAPDRPAISARASPIPNVFAIKRLIRRRFDDPMTRKDMGMVLQVKADNGDAWVQGARRRNIPPRNFRFHSTKMKETAEYLGEKSSHHHRSGLFQRRAARDQGLGKITGLEVLRIINSRRCAPYGWTKQSGTIAVYDLGGGTLDVSVLKSATVFEVKSTNGDTFLGGEDFDHRLVGFLADEFKKENGLDLRGDRLALQRLKDAAEKAKIELSSAQQTEVNLPFITADASGPKHLTIKITRSKLESLVDDLIQKTIGPVKQALKDAGVTAQQIDEVILVGGMTRMPKVQEA